MLCGLDEGILFTRESLTFCMRNHTTAQEVTPFVDFVYLNMRQAFIGYCRENDQSVRPKRQGYPC